MLGYIDLVRSGVLTAPPATPGAGPRVIQDAEIYPYHLVRYPDHVALESFLSCERFPDPYDMLLVQVLQALEAHVSPSLPFCNPPVWMSTVRRPVRSQFPRNKLCSLDEPKLALFVTWSFAQDKLSNFLDSIVQS